MGQVYEEQIECIARVVKGRCVHDFGAGRGELSIAMLDWGANEVIAIEKDARFLELCRDRRNTQADGFRLRTYACTFETFLEKYVHRYPPEVGVVSFPLNRVCRGLVQLVSMCETVIYLGSNTDCTATGTPRLFEHFRKRELLEYKPAPNCTLMVLGKKIDAPRPLTGEEFAAFSMHVPDPLEWIAWDQAERMVAENAPEVKFIEDQIPLLPYYLG